MPVFLVSASTLVLGTRVVAATPTVLAQGRRTVNVESESASATGKGYVLVLRVVRDDGSSIELVRGEGELAKVHATIRRFLDQPKLLDVIVELSQEQGWHGGTRDTHYVIDLRQAPDRITCTFVGNESSGASTTHPRRRSRSRRPRPARSPSTWCAPPMRGART